MTDNIKLPPIPKPHTPPVFATAANTQSVKAGYELGGYEKTPPLFDEHQLETYAREAVRLNAQAVPSVASSDMLATLLELRGAAERYLRMTGGHVEKWSEIHTHGPAAVKEMHRLIEQSGAAIAKAHGIGVKNDL